MVSRAYLLHKPPRPSALTLFVNQRIMPLLIDSAASVEALVESAAVRTRQRPGMPLAVAFCAGALLSALLPRSR